MDLSAKSTERPLLGPMLLVLGAAAACTAAALLAMAAQQPLLGAGVLALAPVAAIVCRRPDFAPPLVVFVLYTNAAVVAVKFHGVPHAVGMLAPLPLVAPLVYWLLHRKREIVLTATLPWIGAFLLVQLLGSLVSSDPREAVKTLQITFIEGLGLYFILTNVVRTPQTLRRCVWALLAAGALMGGLSLWQQITGTQYNDYGGFAQTGEGKGFGVETSRGTVHHQRLCGPLGEQNRYAQIMLMLLPLGMFRMSSERRWLKRGAAIVAIVLAAAACALTFSRGAAVGFVMVMLLMAGMRYLKASHLVVVAAFASIILIAMPSYRARLSSIPKAIGLISRHGAAEQEPDGAIKGRATVMLAAARVFADHPILGVGPGMFNQVSRDYGKLGGFRSIEEAREAHSLYLELAAENGMLGLLTFGMIVSVSMGNLARVRRRQLGEQRAGDAHTTAGFMLALAAYLTTALFLHFSYARYFWLMLALADANTMIERRPQATAQAGDAFTN